MKPSDSKADPNLSIAIEKAADFHGHLGPFLVIGVRMGRVAKNNLAINAENSMELQATVKIPLLTPFSCVLDGIQATVKCTVGNQKLKMKNSQKEITACFKRENRSIDRSEGTLIISANQKTIDELMKEISEGVSNEELAWKVASMSENQLFNIVKR